MRTTCNCIYNFQFWQFYSALDGHGILYSADGMKLSFTCLFCCYSPPSKLVLYVLQKLKKFLPSSICLLLSFTVNFHISRSFLWYLTQAFFYELHEHIWHSFSIHQSISQFHYTNKLFNFRQFQCLISSSQKDTLLLSAQQVL